MSKVGFIKHVKRSDTSLSPPKSLKKDMFLRVFTTRRPGRRPKTSSKKWTDKDQRLPESTVNVVAAKAHSVSFLGTAADRGPGWAKCIGDSKTRKDFWEKLLLGATSHWAGQTI